jgi:hypothetical protein
VNAYFDPLRARMREILHVHHQTRYVLADFARRRINLFVRPVLVLCVILGFFPAMIVSLVEFLSLVQNRWGLVSFLVHARKQ